MPIMRAGGAFSAEVDAGSAPKTRPLQHAFSAEMDAGSAQKTRPRQE
jgi:hypothetical protein